MKLTAKQVKDLNKAIALIEKAKAILEPVERTTDLRYSRNGSISCKAENLIDQIKADADLY